MKYVKGFYEFEEYIKTINNNLGDKFEMQFGYLINLEQIEEIKKKINYDNNKYMYKNKCELISLDNKKQDLFIEEIEFRDTNYLLNMIFNKNKYIFINKDLWQLLSKDKDKNKTSITYEINYNKIKFRFEEQTELIFANKYNNNYISLEEFYFTYNPSYPKFKSNYEYIVKNIYNKIKEYYKFEQSFKNSLNKPDKHSYHSGYLIDFNWFD